MVKCPFCGSEKTNHCETELGIDHYNCLNCFHTFTTKNKVTSIPKDILRKPTSLMEIQRRITQLPYGEETPKRVVHAMISCSKCGFREIRFDMPSGTYHDLQRLYARSQFGKCYKCKSSDTKLVQLKWEIYEKLRENFPNKKAIYTKKTMEELLGMKDEGTNPDIGD